MARVLHALLRHIPDLIWLKDPDGVFLACNARFEELYGAPEEQIRGRTDFDFVSPELAQAFRTTDRLALERDGPSVDEKELRFADGHSERVQTIKTPVRDAQGRVLGVLGIGRDISALRRAEDEYRWLFERNPAPMLVYDRQTLALLRANEAFCALYGWSADELRTMQLTDLYLPEDHDEVRRRTAGMQGLAEMLEWRHRRRDGSVIHVVARSHDTEHDGRPARVAAITDVSALQRGRQRDRQRLAVMERLARGEAHETVLEHLVRAHELLFAGSLCSVLLLDDDGVHLRHGAAPSLPASFNRAIDGQAIGPDVGSCGASCFSGRRVVVDDIDTHPNWAAWREAARQAGLRACWSEPIVGPGQRVLGSFAVYRRDVSLPSPEELEHMQFAVQLAATVIGHAGTARALRDSEQRLSGILQALPDMVWLKDGDGVFRMCNAAFARASGLPVHDIVGRRDTELGTPESAPQHAEQDRQVLASGRATAEERWLTLPDGGRRVQLRVVKTPLFDEQGRASSVLGVASDITEDRRARSRVQRLTRSYAMLSSVNEAVVRLRDRNTLFTEVCRIAVEAGGFRLAWIGERDAGTAEVVPVARFGQGDDFLPGLRIPLRSDNPAPVARAHALARPLVVREVAQEPALAHRRDQLQQLGQRALAVLPIAGPAARWHCLVVYTDSSEHFDDEQMAVLSRLARDIEHALHFIEAEQAQEEAQRLREQIIESVAGLFFAIDRRGRVVLWNKRLEEVSGYEAAELAGQPVAAFFAGADSVLIERRVQQAFDAGEARIEASLVARDGTRLPHLFVGRRVETAGGPLMVGTGIDISDRVRSERELARYRDSLEHLVRQRTAELETVNAQLHREDRRLRAMLRLSQRASELSEDEIFRQGLAEIVALSGSRDGWVRCVDADGGALVLRAGTDGAAPAGADGVAAIEAPVVDGGRTVMVVHAAAKPQPYDDSDRRELQLLAADLWHIVQRRRIEIALGQAKAAADAASQAKSAFLANMSHEIRTPMNAIIGFAHLLARDPLTPRQRDHLAKISDAGRHLLQVINDILDFSKIEAHKITLEEADFALRESLLRVQAMQADAARAKRLPVELEVDPRLPAVLRGDRLRLEQILLNLLSNAVKFTSSGRIGIRVAALQPDGAGPLLRIEVSDTGIGMTAEQLSNVFEAFAQADASTTRRFGGTGLGLAISKRLVQLMHGRIGAHSQPGRGSTFWVELPLHAGAADAARPSAPAPPEPLSGAPKLRGARILVVEDNPINQEVTSTLLGALGATVQIAGSGEEALRAFDPAVHDLVLMDVQMPGLDGLRATAAIRARTGGERVPIVAMTANAFAEDRALCLAAGMNDYLAKPVEPQALERCLLRWLPTLPARAGAAPPLPPADAQALVQQRLQGIDGLDTAAPLARMRGNWGLYVRMLRMFAAHHGSDAERLQAIAATDVPALRALVHSIVGAAATIGATEIVREAQRLQAATAGAAEVGSDTRRALVEAMRRCLHEVQAALEPADAETASAAAPAAAPMAPPPPAEVAAARALLTTLVPLVAAHDTSALTLFDATRAKLEAAFGDGARQLGRQLRQFDFASAQDTLAALRGPQR